MLLPRKDWQCSVLKKIFLIKFNEETKNGFAGLEQAFILSAVWRVNKACKKYSGDVVRDLVYVYDNSGNAANLPQPRGQEIKTKVFSFLVGARIESNFIFDDVMFCTELFLKLFINNNIYI